MKTSDFFYNLPEELIAQHPASERDLSRLLVLDGKTGEREHKIFSDLPTYLRPGDCLVLNNTKVIPARLLGVVADTGAAAEILLLHRREADVWETIVRPGKKLRQGRRVDFIPGRLSCEIEEVLESGNRLVRFFYDGIWEEILDEAGSIPLPPYIHEKLEDSSRYQTVYSKESGSAAAPTAGLHFTKEMLEDMETNGIAVAELTLHVGLGTFRPVKVEDVSSHLMHSEWYSLPQEAADKINAAKARGGRVIAVGTTSCRTLETVASNYLAGEITASRAAQTNVVAQSSGWTDIFIYPGYEFKCVDALVTNFHLPESTLLMLISAFAGKEKIMAAYEEAIRERYRFFSFGDAMFITKE